MPETITASTSAFAIARPPKKFIIMGEAGTGKTTMLGSYAMHGAGPVLINGFDNPDKFDVFEEHWNMIPGPEKFDKEYEIPYRCYFHPKTKALIVRVNYFIEKDYNEPTAWLDFTLYHTFFAKQAHDLKAAGKPQRWNTVAYDSLTATTLKTRMDQQYRVNPTFKDARRWRGETTDEIEKLLELTIPALPMNAVIITHINHKMNDVQGWALHTPNLPGRLTTDVFSQFSELYRLYVDRDEEGKKRRRLQTEADDEYNAYTQIKAPDGCAPDYRALWKNYDAKRAGRKEVSTNASKEKDQKEEQIAG